MNICVLTEKRVDERLIREVEKRLEFTGLTYEKIFYEEGESRIANTLKAAEAVFCAPGRWLSDELIGENTHLKLYQLWSSGFDKFNSDACRRYNIPFNNNGGANAISVAEHTIMLMLAVSRKIYEMQQRTISGNWAGNCQGAEMNTLNNKCVLIVGCGKIGKLVAKICLTMGMKVLVVDPSVDSEMCQLGVVYVNMEYGLEVADIITLHLHYNEQTRGIINPLNLQLMKNNSILINVSRAGLIDQGCIKLIKEKNIRIGIDVYEKEPTSGTEEILGMKQSIFTPHTAGSTLEAVTASIDYS
ncbi:MAG: hypothetical protein EB127_26180, partial [Alphaproteobacteria bacterium]|nr:hypothetical protein [Alphaproteobacteria bacterium]